MTYERFEQLPVWQLAIDLALGVFGLMEDRAFDRKGDLRSQLNRAALSVSNNIAEGFERGTTAELLSFIYIARGSAGEVRSMLSFTEKLDGTEHLRSLISNLKSQSESCSRQLRGWADSLQNSNIKGQRHLNNQVRKRESDRKRSDAFLEKIRAMVPRPWEKNQPANEEAETPPAD